MRRMSRPFRSAAPVSKEEGSRGENGEAGAAEPPPEGTLDQRFWSCPGNAGFRLRGKHYLQACLSRRTPMCSAGKLAAMSGHPHCCVAMCEEVCTDMPKPMCAYKHWGR